MKIAVAIDFSPESKGALHWALDVRDAIRQSDRPVSLLAIHIAAPTWFSMDRSRKSFDDQGLRYQSLTALRNFLEEENRDTDEVSLLVDEGEPAGCIHEIVEREEVELLVIGKSDTSFWSRAFGGATAQKLAHRISCPLAVIDPAHDGFFEGARWVVGVDFSPASEEALWWASKLAAMTRGELHVLHALVDPPLTTMSTGMVNYLSSGDLAHLCANARSSLEGIMEVIQERHPTLKYATLVHSGEADRVLVKYARRIKAQGLILGKAHRSRTMSLLLGGVGRGILRQAPTTLLLIPG